MKQPQTIKLLFVLLLQTAVVTAQNNLSLQMQDGMPFTVLINEKVYNETPQSQVIMTDIVDDTVLVKIALENNERYGVSLYLLHKGKKTSGKEFSYLLKKETRRLRPVFMGMYELKAVERDSSEQKR